jgi:hypothetical protein
MVPCARILAPSVHHMAWWRLGLVGLAGWPCLCSVHSSPVRQACTWRRMNAAILFRHEGSGWLEVRSCTSYRAASEWPTPRWLEMFGGPDLALRNYERSKCERGIYCSELLRYPTMDISSQSLLTPLLQLTVSRKHVHRAGLLIPRVVSGAASSW